MGKRTSHRWLLALALTAASWTAQGAATRPTLVSGGGRIVAGVLTTDERGALYDLPGGAQVRAAPRTTFQVRAVPENLQLTPGKRTRTYSVLLYGGRLDVQVPEPKADPPAVLVRAPKFMGVIVTSGSAVAVVDKLGVTVANRHGATLSQEGAAWTRLTAGKARTRSARDPLAQPRPIIQPPEKVADAALRAAFSGSAPICNLSWSPVAGAVAYDVELADADARVLSTRRVEGSKLGCDFASVGPGVYTFRVRAIDKQGIESCEWTSRNIRVVGAQLPAGGYFGSDGSVYLPKDRQVTFSHIDGLQMTYGTEGTYFVNAIPNVGLFRNGAVSVVFRHPSNGEKLNITLKPRNVVAHVELGPKTAVWPRDSINVTVKLRGLPAELRGIEPEMRVQLGLTPLPVKWQRKADVWTARIRPKRGPGPWVVRVEVTDQHGAFLGRNFLEVVAEPR